MIMKLYICIVLNSFATLYFILSIFQERYNERNQNENKLTKNTYESLSTISKKSEHISNLRKRKNLRVNDSSSFIEPPITLYDTQKCIMFYEDLFHCKMVNISSFMSKSRHSTTSNNITCPKLYATYMKNAIPVNINHLGPGIFIEDSIKWDIMQKKKRNQNRTNLYFEISLNSTPNSGTRTLKCDFCRLHLSIHDYAVLSMKHKLYQVSLKNLKECRPEFSDKLLNINRYRQNRKLILYDNAIQNNKAQWMASLHMNGLFDNTQLRHIVLPGSHNSASVQMRGDKHCGGPLDLSNQLANKFAMTQGVSIVNQLDQHGIRLLDLRVIENRDFHGLKYPLHHTYLINDKVNTLDAALDVISDFLKRNTMETVVVRVKGRSTEGGQACFEIGTNQTFHRQEWEKMIQRRDMFVIMTRSHLDTNMKDLKGFALFDFSDEVIYEDWPGQKFNNNEKNKIDIFHHGTYYKNRTGKHDKFTIWDFFPNMEEDKLVLFLTSISVWHEGLREWNQPYSQHMWIMDSLISLRTKHVHGIIADQVDTTPIFELASRLTLYRIFHRLAPSSWDLVSTHHNVNAWDEDFEHHCPHQYVLQGLSSYHDNQKEDRAWKFSCRRVNWLSSHTFHSSENSTWKPGFYHPQAFQELSKTSFFVNEFDGNIDFHWQEGNVAITGIGGKHKNRYEDRLYYFYASRVMAKPSSCSWSPFINNWDENLDFQIDKTQYFAGVYSYHNNRYEDRRWRLYICSIA